MSSSTQNKSSERRITKDAKLPWWVELLFVQVGLPDKWLSGFLKSKRKSQAFIIDNRKSLYYLSLFIIALTFIQPLSRYYARKNRCINWSVNKSIEEQLVIDKELINAIAINYCNGGI
tara:strand:+ start:2344 stop:2697 length:354 start_codon:yes stop_codon:yes gene_type:complete